MSKKVWPLLQKRFPKSEYALLQEVRNAAGFNASRSADGIAMGLWPSRGLEVHGLEVKISRGDWLREMKQPQKAEAIFKYCDRWWLVCGDEFVAKKEEIPPTWGLLVVKGERLLTVVDAPKLTPEPLDRGFVAAMLKRSVQGMISESSITEHIEKAKAQAVESALRTDVQYKDRLLKLQEEIRVFEQASGISINRYEGPKRIGNAVRVVLSGGSETIKQQLLHLKESAIRISTNLENALQGLDDSQPEPTTTRSSI